MGYSNLRQTTDVVFDADPVGSRRVVGLARAIWQRIQGQGVGVYDLANTKGSPELSYGGSYIDGVQAQITSSVAKIGTPSVYRDTGAADISSGVTDANAGATRMFAERLRRGGAL